MTPVTQHIGLSLRRNASWTLAAHVVYALAQWGLLIALARLADPAALGAFTLALAVTAPVLMLANLQLRGLLASDSRRAVPVGVYVSVRLATTGSAILLLLTFAAFGPYRGQTALVIVGVAIAKSVESISDVLHGYLHRHERLDIVARSLMVRGALGLAGFALVVPITGSLVAGTAMLAGANVIVLLAIDVRAVKAMARVIGEPSNPLVPVWSKPVMARLAWSALPLGVVMMLLSLGTAVPRYVIEAHWDEAVLGSFSAIAYALALLTPVASAIGQAALPRLAQAYAQRTVSAYASLSARLILIGVALGVLGVLVAAVAGQQLLTLFYGAEYAQHAGAFILVMVAAGMSSVASFCGFILTAARYLRSQAVLLLIALAAVLVTSLVLVPERGVDGGAWAMVSGSAVQMLGTVGLVLASVVRHSPQDERQAEESPGTCSRPLRVLHVIGSLERGGVESWLRHVVEEADPDELMITVVTHTPGEGAYGAQMRRRGARLYHCSRDDGMWRYQRRFRSILRREGPFDVVHSHVHHYSGFVLALAAMEKVPVRIAHAHTDSSTVDRGAGLARRIYLRTMLAMLRLAATGVHAASAVAGQSLTRGAWAESERNRIVRCAIDLTPFRSLAPIGQVRQALCIPVDAVVIGHVGRFDEAKNQTFLLDVLAAAVRTAPGAHLLLVGDGPLRRTIEERIVGMGLTERVTLTGHRDDIPTLMSAMDVFILPSMFEGLPLVTVEAQAAGLPLVVSDSVTRDIAIAPGVTTFMSLQESPERWADVALWASAGDRGARHRLAMETLARSPFEISTGVAALVTAYRAGLNDRSG